jgi:D-sedoheptulose 7-phosphate isomerase
MSMTTTAAVVPAAAAPTGGGAVRAYVADYLSAVRALLAAVEPAEVERVVDVLWDAYQRGGRLVLCGNGGSASTASHLVCDFQKNVYLEGGRAWEVVALTDSPALLTAWGNDTEFANVFAGQARTWLRPGDVLIAISGSGNSPNVLGAVDVANEVGATSIGWSGFGGGRLAERARVNVVIENHNMQQVEDLHMILGHVVFAALRDRIKGLLAP